MMKFTDSHEWVKVEGDKAIVGVSNHAQQELGDIVFVELPKVGKEVKQGEEVAVLESTKAAADVYSPVSGTITEVNALLQSQSELVNQSAEDKGWLYKIALKNTKELDSLMDQTAYLAKFS